VVCPGYAGSTHALATRERSIENRGEGRSSSTSCSSRVSASAGLGTRKPRVSRLVSRRYGSAAGICDRSSHCWLDEMMDSTF
jgi:hypothetical protein